jgi:AcrR family transcriptional regulator
MSEETGGLRERKKRELKSELSRFGIRLFTQQGFDQTTVEDIVGPLRVSKRTFFRYFASKEDVVFAWYEELTGELLAELSARPKDEAPFEAACATLRSLLRYYDADPKWALAMQRLAVWERELAALLQKRLPAGSGRGPMARELQARVIVGCAMTAFTSGVNAWAEARGKTPLGPFVDKAFAYAKAL